MCTDGTKFISASEKPYNQSTHYVTAKKINYPTCLKRGKHILTNLKHSTNDYLIFLEADNSLLEKDEIGYILFNYLK